MEPLPRGAQFIRAKMLWEIALGVAGDPAIPYTGNRDIAIFIGNGSGDSFTPAIRLSPGSPALSYAVARGDLEAAFVNPSAMLTQAYRGTGLYTEALPLRVIVSYPSWDRFVIMVQPRLGLTSLADIKEKRLPLRVSVRQDPTHSTRVLLDQLLPMYGFNLGDVESWGGSLQLNGGPSDERRLAGIRDGSVDIVFDEGIPSWLPLRPRSRAEAAGAGRRHHEPHGGPGLAAGGAAQVALPTAGARRRVHRLQRMAAIHARVVAGRGRLPDLRIAVAERAGEIPWDEGAYTGIEQLGNDTDATPLDVPLHPGAAQWFREQGYSV